MKKVSTKSANGKRSRPKIKLGIPDLEHSKNAVLRSLGSPDSRRGYQHACSCAPVGLRSSRRRSVEP
jgi:hypothetical protein